MLGINSNPCPELPSSQLQYLFPEELAQGQRSGRALVPGPLPGGFAGHCLRRGRGLRRFRVLLRRRLLGGRDIPVCFYTGNSRLLRALGKRRTWITWRTNPARSGISWCRRAPPLPTQLHPCPSRCGDTLSREAKDTASPPPPRTQIKN